MIHRGSLLVRLLHRLLWLVFGLDQWEVVVHVNRSLSMHIDPKKTDINFDEIKCQHFKPTIGHLGSRDIISVMLSNNQLHEPDKIKISYQAKQNM
jgi:hypothetical protein